MKQAEAGFREIAHTADWELEVWAPNMMELLKQAAQGMYALCGVHLKNGSRRERELRLETTDCESLLVQFLTELLYIYEMEHLAFDEFDLNLNGGGLHARLVGAEVEKIDKEIKAVTYHRLQVRETEQGFTVNIVFDV